MGLIRLYIRVYLVYLEVQGSLEDPYIVCIMIIMVQMCGIEYVIYGIYSWRFTVVAARP